MTKKKKLLLGIISLIVLIAVQIFFISTYDYFKAEGGMKIELSMDPNDVPKKYARASLDYDYIMKDAVRKFNANGGDFLEVLAETNKNRSSKSLVHLLSYKEIKELSMDSQDDEVIDFLRAHIDRNLEASAEFYEKRIQRVINKTADVSYDSETLRMSIKIPGQMDSLDPQDFRLPQIDLGFYECFTMSELANSWNSACLLTEPDSIPETEWKLTDLNKAKVAVSQSLGNTVQWPYKGVGFVKVSDRKYVEETLRLPEIRELFPSNLSFRWSRSTQRTDYGDVWQMYAVKIPEGGRPIISNEDISSASLDLNEAHGDSVLSIKMTPEGTEKWAKMTAENVGRIIAMSVNGVVYSAPNVMGVIHDGITQISGRGGEKLENLELVLNARSIEIHSIDSTTTFVKADPPILSAMIQKILVAVSILILLFLGFKFFTASRDIA